MNTLTKKIKILMLAFIATIMLSGQLSYAQNAFFGVCAHPWAPYTNSSAATLMGLTQQLGAGLYRVDLYTNQYAYTDALLAAAGSRNIQLLAILYGTSGNYSASYNEGYAFAQRYRGRIPYYQLSNERDNETIAWGDGSSPSHYDNAKYAASKAEIQGLLDGIRAADPYAKTIVNFTWLHYGYIQRLMNDGVNYFDIIGVDWYWGDIKNVNGLNLPSYLRTNFNKPVWVTEANRLAGSQGGNEAAQSTWISQNAAAYYDNPDISACIIYELLDEPGAGAEFASYGLMYNASSQKSAFNAYKQAIAPRPYPRSNSYYRIRNLWKNTYLHHFSGAGVDYGTLSASDQRSHWQFIRLSDGSYNIKNRADGTYMNVENNYSWVECYAINPAWGSPRWFVSNSSSAGYSLIKNSWRSGEKIHVENQTGYAQHGTNIPDGWGSPQWKLEPVN